MFDTQMIIEKRRRGDKDFIAHSLELFIDFIQIFRKVIIILMQKVSFFLLNITNDLDQLNTFCRRERTTRTKIVNDNRNADQQLHFIENSRFLVVIII